MAEVSDRLRASEEFLKAFENSRSRIAFDSGVLQLRKALEATAYAAIAPNKPKYQAFRAKADDHADFAKDFRASKIFKHLSTVNKDFYPTPLLPPQKQADGTWHFDRKKGGFLTKKRFERTYDRLGKYLHADNPWSSKKHAQNMAASMPQTIDELRSLLALHVAFIQSPGFKGAWVVDVPVDGTLPSITSAVASGEFVVNGS